MQHCQWLCFSLKDRMGINMAQNVTLWVSVVCMILLFRNEDKEFVNLAVGKRRNGCIMLAKILQYLDCPQYLRKSLFPQQPDLKFAGKSHYFLPVFKEAG